MHHVLVPIFVCAILPIAIVWIVFRSITNSDNRRAEVLIKAIEANNDIDADKLAQALSKPRKSAIERLNSQLLRGCIFTMLGLGLTAVCAILCANGMDIEADTAWLSLIGGMASLAVGISYLVVYFMTRKQITAGVEE